MEYCLEDRRGDDSRFLVAKNPNAHIKLIESLVVLMHDPNIKNPYKWINGVSVLNTYQEYGNYNV